MFKTLEGFVRDGKIELTEPLGDIPDETPVIVTFIEPHRVDQAADLRARLSSFVEEWESPEMDIYDHFDSAKK